MNILIIAVQYPPSLATGAKRPWLLAKELRKWGHRVTVLSQIEENQESGNRNICATLGQFGERILRIRPQYSAVIKDASYRCFWRMRRVLDRCTQLLKSDVAILTGPPFFHFFLVSQLRKLNVPVVLDYRDGWGADPYSYRSLKDYFFRQLGRHLEARLFGHASAAVFISESLRNDHLSMIGQNGNEKAFVVPNGVDIEEFRSAVVRDLKSDLGLSADTRLFLYAGSLSADIGADQFMNSLRNILNKKPAALQLAKFLFLGPSSEYSKWFDDRLLGDTVFFLPPVSLYESYGYMKATDVLISLGGKQTQRLNRKIFEYAAAGHPVLHVGNPDGETATIVLRHNLGPVVDSADSKALEEALCRLAEGRVTPRSNHEIHATALVFSTSQGLKAYLKILEHVRRHVRA